MHIDMADKLCKKMTGRNLGKLCSTEMNLAFGEDANGRAAGKFSELSGLLAWEASGNRGQLAQDRARLLAIYQIAQQRPLDTADRPAGLGVPSGLSLGPYGAVEKNLADLLPPPKPKVPPAAHHRPAAAAEAVVWR